MKAYISQHCLTPHDSGDKAVANIPDTLEIGLNVTVCKKNISPEECSKQKKNRKACKKNLIHVKVEVEVVIPRVSRSLT